MPQESVLLPLHPSWRPPQRRGKFIEFQRCWNCPVSAIKKVMLFSGKGLLYPANSESPKTGINRTVAQPFLNTRQAEKSGTGGKLRQAGV